MYTSDHKALYLPELLSGSCSFAHLPKGTCKLISPTGSATLSSLSPEWRLLKPPLLSNLHRRPSFSGGLEKTGSLEIIPENCPLDPAGRLSISLDDQNLSSGPSRQEPV